MMRKYLLEELQGLVAEINDLLNDRRLYPLKAADVAGAHPWLLNLLNALSTQEGWITVHQFGERVEAKLFASQETATILVQYPGKLSLGELHEAGLTRCFYFKLDGDRFIWTKTLPSLPEEEDVVLHYLQ